MAFFWDPLQEKAKRDGELVYAMDQGQTPVLADYDPRPNKELRAPGPWGVASSGFCVGLAMRWIALRYQGKDYPFDHRRLLANGEFWVDAARDQNVSRSTVGPWPIRFERVLRQYGVPVAASAQHPFAITARLILATIAAGNGLYYFEMRGEQNAHAIAVQNEQGRLHLFDGNEGHFLVKSLDRARYFLTYFLNHAPGNYRVKYTKATWIAGVRR
jgi:hypothetical protein